MRRPALLALVALCVPLGACTDDADRSSASVTVPATVSSSSSPSETATPVPPRPSPTPAGAILADVPPDTPADEVPLDDLVAAGSDVTGHWIGAVGAVEHLVVAVAGEGDAFARDRTLWRWTPAPDLGGWLGVPLLDYPATRGVLDLDAVVADVTGDGNDDVLVFALTGGSGACGVWSVADLASTRRIYARDLCDGSIEPSTQPVGLLVTESVYRPGDAHCCPSARRETVLFYDDDGSWQEFDRETIAF